MTEASRQALTRLRDLSTLQWYVIPLLAIVFYIYASEMKKARASGNWDAVLAGLTLFGMDFVNETWNGWVLVLTGRSALWTAPGPTALRTMVGWNIEIMFMFLLAGIIYYNTLSEEDDTFTWRRPLWRRPEAWLWAVGYSVFCVFVEVLLNQGGLLIWEYPFWNWSLGGIWLIFLIGYFHFFVAIILVLSLSTLRKRLAAVAGIWAVAIVMNVIGMGVLGWRY
jgi:hypothetical protein